MKGCLFLSVDPAQNGENPCVSNKKGTQRSFSFCLRQMHLFATISTYFGRPGRRPAAHRKHFYIFCCQMLPVPPGKVSLADASVLHKGGIASINQGENPDFKLK